MFQLGLVLEYYVDVEERGGILGVGVRIGGVWAGIGDGRLVADQK